MSKAKKIFVTGGTGFLGSYLIRYLLKAGHQVRALKRATSKMDLVAPVADQVEWIEGDLSDTPLLEDALQDIQQIYHCAAMVSFDPKDIEEMIFVNVEGTANLVNVALETNPEKLVHISSIAAIGRTKEHKHISEKTKWQRSKLNSYYAISKYQAEQEVWRGVAEGLNAAIINPSVILGSGFWEVGSGKFFTNIWEGLKYYPPGTTGFVDVRDVAKLAIQLMSSDILAQRFIANGENLKYETILAEIAKGLGKTPPSMKATPFLSAIAWRLAWLKSKITGKKPLLTRATAKLAGSTYFYDNKASLESFDFKYTPIQQTIQETAEQFLLAKKENLAAKFLKLN